jgi:hypothetical protein
LLYTSKIHLLEYMRKFCNPVPSIHNTIPKMNLLEPSLNMSQPLLSNSLKTLLHSLISMSTNHKVALISWFQKLHQNTKTTIPMIHNQANTSLISWTFQFGKIVLLKSHSTHMTPHPNNIMKLIILLQKSKPTMLEMVMIIQCMNLKHQQFKLHYLLNSSSLTKPKDNMSTFLTKSLKLQITSLMIVQVDNMFLMTLLKFLSVSHQLSNSPSLIQKHQLKNHQFHYSISMDIQGTLSNSQMNHLMEPIYSFLMMKLEVSLFILLKHHLKKKEHTLMILQLETSMK